MVMIRFGVINLTMNKRDYILGALMIVVVIALVITISVYVDEVREKNGGHFFKPKIEPPLGNPTQLNMTRIIRAGEPQVG